MRLEERQQLRAVARLIGLMKAIAKPIALNAVAGLIAALTASAILLTAECIKEQSDNRKDIEYIRDILIEGRKNVRETEATFPKGMAATMPADEFRADQYNFMIKELQVALDNWVVHLTHFQRKELYDALDWFHTEGLYAIRNDGKVVFLDFPEGKWPLNEMSIEQARRRFERLQSIKWLKMQDN